jgi:urease accessory protein
VRAGDHFADDAALLPVLKSENEKKEGSASVASKYHVVIPRLGLGIHEFRGRQTRGCQAFAWHDALKMRQAIERRHAGEWPEAQATGSVTLRYADRCRRRIQMSDDSGKPFLLALPRMVRLADGDGLRLDTDGFLRVAAALEPLLEVSGADASQLAKLAWHIGNRHVPAEVVDGTRLRIAFDSVLETMLHGLGAKTRRIEAPFHPEGGAYGQVEIHTHAH